MSYMFSFCFNLNNVDLSSFDIKNVIDMKNIFFKCENLINLEGANLYLMLSRRKFFAFSTHSIVVLSLEI